MDDARRLFEDEQHREAVCHLQAARTQGPPPAPCPVCRWKPCGGHTTNLPRTGLVCLQPGDLPEEVCQVQTCQTAQGTGGRLPRQGAVCPSLAGRDMSASLTPQSIPVCQRPLWHCLLQDSPDTPCRPAPSAETDTQARSSGDWRSRGLRADCPSGILPRNQAPYGKDCFLFGRRSCGYLDVRTHDGTRLSACSCRKDTASSGTEQHLSHRT